MYLRPATENLQNKLEAESATDSILHNGGKDDAEDAEDTSLDVITVIRYISEIATLLGVLSYLILQQGDEIKNQGLPAFLKQLVRVLFAFPFSSFHFFVNCTEFSYFQANAPAKAIFLISNVMILSCIPYRILGDTDTEEAILVFAVPGSWFLLMFFAG